MITILPMEDSAGKARILSRFPATGGRTDVIVMREKDEVFGTAVLAVDGGVVQLWDVAVSGQDLASLDGMGRLVADSLVRAAASYGETFGAVRIEAYLPALSAVLAQQGFVPAQGCMAAPMSAIVRRTKPREETDRHLAIGGQS